MIQRPMRAVLKDVAEVDEQRVRHWRIVNVAAGDLEVDRQALVVLDDLGCAESIFTPLAAASPVFLIRTPSVNGSGGSIAAVIGSSPITSLVRK